MKYYHEISPLVIYNLYYEDTYFYFGSGISFIWGLKQNNSGEYNQIGLPFIAGFNISFSENILGGIELLSNIISKTSFWGFGLNISIKL